jgi:PAS domain S-box-containing protein
LVLALSALMALLLLERMRRRQQEARLQDRREHEARLIESEARHRALVDLSPDGVVVVSDRRIVFANRAAAAMGGHPDPASVIGREAGEFLSGRFRPMLGDLDRLQAGTAEPMREIELRLPDGGTRTVEVAGRPLVFNGRPSALLVLRDVTDRRRMRDELREREALFRAALDALPHGFILYDAAGRVQFANRLALELRGGSPDDPVGPGEAEVLPPELARASLPLLRQAHATGAPQCGDCTFEVGGRRWITEAHFIPLLGEAGEVRQIVGLVLDRTAERTRQAWLHLVETALSHAANAVVITDRDGTILWVNPAFTRMTGYSAEEAVGRTPRILRSGRQDAAFYRQMWDTILRGEVWQGELVNRCKDGREFTEELTITPVRGGAGEVTHFIAIQQDITARKLAQERADFLKFNIDHGAEAMYWAVPDEGFRLAYVNRAACEHFCYEEEDLLGQALPALDLELEADGGRGFWERLRAAGSLTYESVHRRRDGELVPVEVSSSYIRYGDRDYCTGTARVILERKRAEARIRHLNRAYLVLGQVGEAVARLSDQKRLLDEVCRIAVESGFCSLAWVGRAESPGQALQVVAARSAKGPVPAELHLPPGPGPERRSLASVLARRGGVFMSPDLAQDPDLLPWRDRALQLGYRSAAVFCLHVQGAFWGLVSLFSEELGFFDAEEGRLLEQLAATLSHALDVLARESEREAIERALRRSQKMEALGKLTGGIAHDFNNLLGIIIGNLDLLKEQLPSGTPAITRVDTALRSALRGAKLTERLLQFSRQHPTPVGRLNLGPVLTGMQDLLARTLTREVEVSIAVEPGLWDVELDPDEFQDALVNLAVNARDAMPAGGRLTLRAANLALPEGSDPRHQGIPPGEYVHVVVQDTGIGMSPDVLERIFEPFFTTKEAGKGTGLGLSMVYSFLQRSRGQVRVESKPGAGTAFHLYFPRASAPAAPAPSREPPELQPAGRGETILVVEDEPELREAVSAILRRLGYQVRQAASAAEAWETLQGGAPIDLLFTDVVMPGGMDGFELAERALARWPGLRVVVTSGYTERLQSPKAAHARHVLLKPYRLQELARQIRMALEPAGGGP